MSLCNSSILNDVIILIHWHDKCIIHQHEGIVKIILRKEVNTYEESFFMLALALLISVAFVTTVFAQAKPEVKPADKPAAVAAEKARLGEGGREGR